MSLEVLAPVGNEEGVKVAINAGANAVYFGLPKFNARAKAENITMDNLKTIVDFCHVLDVKVYVTINTIIKDGEMEELLDLVKRAIDANVDAFIVQDLGVAYRLINTFKNITLHASTQMGIHNLKGAKQVEELGIKRVILSRETKLQDIIDIKNNTNLEIEYFVQGALCVAFSGNCYLSSILNDKSGNRGECLQLCRLKYDACNDNGLINQGYMLSTCDLCLLDKLKDLIKAGVTSFKIEGRLRRYGYIAESVKQYSKMLNYVSQNDIESTTLNTKDKDETKNLDYNRQIKQSENALMKVFNRGEYNKGIYLTENNNAKIINPLYQNHRGVKVGKVLEVKPFKALYQIRIGSNHKLTTNDGLKFVDDDNDEISIGVGNVIQLNQNEYKIFSNKKPKVGSHVYLTVDANHESELLDYRKKLDVFVTVKMYVGEYPLVTVKCKNIEFEMKGNDKLQPALNSPISVQNIIECFNKVDGLPFNVKTKCALGGVFIPKSILNDLRRRVFEKLYNELILDYNSKYVDKVSEHKFIDKKLVDDNNYSVVVTDKYFKELLDYDIVIYSPKNYDVKNIKDFYKAYNHKLYLNLPIICNYLDTKKIDKIIKQFDPSIMGLVANNVYGLSYLKQGYDVIGGYGLNIANKYTIMYLNSLKVKTYIRTIEPKLNYDFKYGLKYMGNVALMTLSHCPYKTSFGYSDCADCKCDDGLKYVLNNREFKINRYIVSGCYFELKDTSDIEPVNQKGVVYDNR